MAAEYFLYNTLYNNTLVDRSGTTFTPLPPNTGEIYVDYFIPTIQPLYLYRETGGTIIANDQDTINAYLYSIAPPPEPEDNVLQFEFTGYTATTNTEIEGIKNEYLPLTGGTISGALSFTDNDGGVFGQVIEGVNGALKIAGDVGINLTSPALIFPSASGFSGSYLTVGQDGLITFTSAPTGGTGFWQNTEAGPDVIPQNIEIDLGVPVTITSDVDNGNGEWRLDADNYNNQTANIILRFIKDNVLVYEESYSIPKNETATLAGSLPFASFQANGSVYDIRMLTTRAVVVSDILFRINKVSSGGGGASTWGSITGTLSNQTDLQLALDSKVNRAGDTITGDLKINQSLYVTGTSATTQELEDAVLLGALTSDGKIVATNTPALNVSEEVTDINSSTGITEISGIYYVDTTGGDITVTIPDAALSNDAKRMSIIKKSGNNNVIITTVGGVQNIGNQTTQVISQTDKGLTIVGDNDNQKWIITQDSRYLEGMTEGEFQYWDNTLKIWKSTTNDITWNNTDLTFNVGGNSTPQTFQVNADEDIVYINAEPLSGLTTADDLGFYAGGRGAFGNAVTIDKLRAEAAGNVPRSLSLIDDNAVMRIWRTVNDGGDPAVEFVWGTGATPTTIGNSWWDMYLDGQTDSFAIRSRTLGNDTNILTTSITGVSTPFILSTDQKVNLGQYSNTSTSDGDFWWDGDGLYIQSATTSINLLPPIGELKSVQVRQSTQVNTIPTSWTDFSWDSTDIENDENVIKHDNTNTDRVYVYESGLYFISYQYQIDDESSTRVRVNDTTVINGSETTADATAASLPMSKSFLVNLVAGDYVTMQTLGLANGQDIDAGATMIVVKYDGLKGDKGADGAGAAIILQSENVNVPNTPHGTLNFDDNFTVTDNGSGKATVGYVPTGNATDGKIQLVDSVGGQDIIPIAATALTWGQEDFKDTATFTHAANGSTITVLKTGLYELSYNVNGAASVSNRSIPGIQFRNNSTVIAPTLSSDYQRNAANNDTNNSLAPYLISLTANDVLDVVAFRLGDGSATASKAGASFVRVTYLGL